MARQCFALAVIGCTMAAVAAIEAHAPRSECDRRSFTHTERDVLEACATLSLNEIDNRDLKRAQTINTASGSVLSESKATPFDTSPTKRYRQRSVLEMQPYLIMYGIAIATVSPLASCYQLVKLNPQVEATFSQMLRLSLAILPHQAALKDAQMTIATPIKKHCNPWAAFALIGVLQGGLYGHSNVHFANALSIGSRPSLSSVFKGMAFAGSRDLVSQGFPFVLAPKLQKSVFDRLLPSKANSVLSGIKQWMAVFSMSVVGTYMSQFFHNSQITMQSNPDLGYVGAVRKLFDTNGFAAFYKGAEARVGLLLLVAGLNEVLLKKAWQGVEVTTKKKVGKKPSRKPLVSNIGAVKKVTAREITEHMVRRPSIGGASGLATVPQAA